MDDRDANDRADGLELRLSTHARPRQLSWLRRRVREFLAEHGSPPDVVDDLELVVSELGTNVIRHTDSDLLSLRLAGVDGHWVLDVADADDLTVLDDIVLPAPHTPDGRGLYIAAALTDELTTVEIGGRSYVRCRRADPTRSSTT